MNKKHFSMLGLIGFIVFDIITSVAFACTPTYKQGYLQIPAVEQSEFSWVLKKISEKPLKFSIDTNINQYDHSVNANCDSVYYHNDLIDISNVQLQNGAGVTVANYSLSLKLDTLKKTATASYYQKTDAVPRDFIKVQNKRLSAVSLTKAIADYFEKPELSFVTAYELSSIAILVTDGGYFIVSKNDWMSPIIAFTKGIPTENGILSRDLVSLDKNIYHRINQNIVPRAGEQQSNKQEWQYIFSLLNKTSKSIQLHQQKNIRLAEAEVPNNWIWGLSQSGKIINLEAGSYSPSISKFAMNQYVKPIKNSIGNMVRPPVGCSHLAIARIMNWHQYPVGDMFGTKNQYYLLNRRQVTNDFLHLVSDIGSPGGANSKYTLNEGTGMYTEEILSVFTKADYDAVILEQGGDHIFNIAFLYSAIEKEVNAERPSLLTMWWDNFSPNSTCANNRCGHAVVVTGYKSGIIRNYIEIAFGWDKTAKGAQRDYYLMELSPYVLSLFSDWTVTPKISYLENHGNFEYKLIGNISPKNTTYELSVTPNGNGSIIGNTPYTDVINCGGDNYICSRKLFTKSIVTLTAQPKFGYKFVNWSGDCSGKKSCTLIMAKANKVTANFAPIVKPPTGVKALIAVGAGHALALKSDGTVVRWGRNNEGQLNIPAELNNNIVSVAAGGYHSLALKSDGTVVAWGWNQYGQTTIPIGLANIIAIEAGHSHSLALKSDGTVIAWGRSDYGLNSVPSGLANVVAISAGDNHSLALKSDGTVVAWGYSGLTNVPVGLVNVVAIAAGSNRSLALKSDGTVVSWGADAVPYGLSNVIAVAAGQHSLVLKANGTVEAWGWNGDGQANVPSGLTNVVAISAGNFHSLVLKSDGTVLEWGSSCCGQLNIPPGLNLK